MRRNGSEQERKETFLRVVRMAGINSALWHVTFTLWLFQCASPSFSSPPYLEFSFKRIIMFMALPVQDPRTKQKGQSFLLPLSSCVLDRWPGRWTGFLMFALFISAWSGGLTDTPTPHKCKLRFSLFSFSFCLFPPHASLPMHLPFSLCPLPTILCG